MCSPQGCQGGTCWAQCTRGPSSAWTRKAASLRGVACALSASHCEHGVLCRAAPHLPRKLHVLQKGVVLRLAAEACASPAASATALAPGPPSRVPASQLREQDHWRCGGSAARRLGSGAALVCCSTVGPPTSLSGSAAPSPQCGPLEPSRTWLSVGRDVGAARTRPAITAPGPGPGG